MMQESGVYQAPAGAERVEIPHSLGVAPNVVQVSGAPDGSKVFTLENKALLVLLPPGSGACELAWTVGYEQPPEPEHIEEEMGE